ncbi:integrin alpha-M-like [Protopterus annectens]|uniref:integrin alpha-M-like n=1 Tax=Protopterus annectens TaxID=7888 RepID=UPI001CFB78BB|nr:integrin alpha-M-like [Protopterus annectens]
MRIHEHRHINVEVQQERKMKTVKTRMPNVFQKTTAPYRILNLKLFFHEQQSSKISDKFKYYKSSFMPPMNQHVSMFQNAIIKDLHFQYRSFTPLPNNISKTCMDNITKLANNHELVITGADKGGLIVVQDLSQYDNEAFGQLSNVRYYTQLTIDPTPVFKQQIDSFLTLAVEEAFSLSCGFNIDVKNPKIFQDAASSFGYKVIQYGSVGSERIIVSAPLEKGLQNRIGKIFSCNYNSAGQCSEINVNEPPEAEKISLGLTLVSQQSPRPSLLVCGPTLPKDCSTNMHVIGMCFHLNDQLYKTRQLPTKLSECPKTLIVFLIDGSGSVAASDFLTMKEFVKNIMTTFQREHTLFSVMQYSHRFTTHFTFKMYSSSSDRDSLVDNIVQLTGATHTPTAIRKVVDELFIEAEGAMPEDNKILIVITDGKTYGDYSSLPEAIQKAQNKGITRYAIGVGNAFDDPTASLELRTIASTPTAEFRFKVSSFAALRQLQKTLEQKIFAIEGTQTQSGSASFQQEMSQEGLSALVQSNSILTGAAGSYDWAGGFFHYGPDSGFSRSTFNNVTSTSNDMKDAYLGYAMATYTDSTKEYFIVGAPRYNHTGRVFVFEKISQKSALRPDLTIPGEQIGSYFGAELCTINPGISSQKKVLLIGAPLHYSSKSGGQVYICRLERKFVCTIILHGEPGHPYAKFGATIAEIKDINGDSLTDVAIGAPLENNHQGSVYIFYGNQNGIRSHYSQRIQGVTSTLGLRYFGQSIHGIMDMNRDGLVDIAVGSLGKVLVLQSRPIVSVDALITFTPRQIPLKTVRCRGADKQEDSSNALQVCFTLIKKTTDNLGSAPVTITYNLKLDSLRQKERVTFGINLRDHNGSFTDITRTKCIDASIKIPACIRDTFAPIAVGLQFSVVGRAYSSDNLLTPILSEESKTQLIGELHFEKNCGPDTICKDHLILSFNFTRAEPLVVGLNPVINLTVAIENRGEDSYNTLVTFFYPSGLSFRRATLPDKLSFISCDGTVGTEDTTMRDISCRINHPVFFAASKIAFTATFDVFAKAAWENTLVVSANATSDNAEHLHHATDVFDRKELPVKFGINVLVTRHIDSTRYANFSSQKQENKKIIHIYKVENLGQWPVPVVINFLVPYKLKNNDVWNISEVVPSGKDLSNQNNFCKYIKDVVGNSENIAEKIEKSKTLDCTIATCKQFQCSISRLEIKNELTFEIQGDVFPSWIAQTLLKKVFLASSASIIYDGQKYVHVSQDQDIFIKAEATTELEVYDDYNYLPIIIGSTVGGLLLLGLITLGLYKAGFFNRQYKDLMNEAQEGGTESNAADGSSPPPSQPENTVS